MSYNDQNDYIETENKEIGENLSNYQKENNYNDINKENINEEQVLSINNQQTQKQLSPNVNNEANVIPQSSNNNNYPNEITAKTQKVCNPENQNINPNNIYIRNAPPNVNVTMNQYNNNQMNQNANNNDRNNENDKEKNGICGICTGCALIASASACCYFLFAHLCSCIRRKDD